MPLLSQSLSRPSWRAGLFCASPAPARGRHESATNDCSCAARAKYNHSATAVQPQCNQQCNRSTTIVQPQYNHSATTVQPQCNHCKAIAATVVTPVRSVRCHASMHHAQPSLPSQRGAAPRHDRLGIGVLCSLAVPLCSTNHGPRCGQRPRPGADVAHMFVAAKWRCDSPSASTASASSASLTTCSLANAHFCARLGAVRKFRVASDAAHCGELKP